MAAPTIVEINPADQATGIVLSDTISVTFDQEVDHTTVNLFIEGPDHDRWSGPDLAYWDDPTTTSDDNILESPGYHGIVPGEISFVKVDTEGNEVSGVYDYTGQGTTWRTKVVFTPTDPLAPGVQYRVYIIGDEESNDEILSGVSSRTVFDTYKGANLGDGEVEFTGGYTGTVEDKVFIEILNTGEAGEVEFQYYWQSAPLITRQLKSSKTSQILANGVYVRFISGTFQTGDTFSVVVKPAGRKQETYAWVFTTGSGSIQAVPEDTYSTSAIADEITAQEPLSVVSITPADKSTNLDPDTVTEIVIQFNKDLDETTISDSTVLVWTEPVNGDFATNDIEFSGVLAKVLSVDGDTLTIQIT